MGILKLKIQMKTAKTILFAACAMSAVEAQDKFALSLQAFPDKECKEDAGAGAVLSFEGTGPCQAMDVSRDVFIIQAKLTADPLLMLAIKGVKHVPSATDMKVTFFSDEKCLVKLDALDTTVVWGECGALSTAGVTSYVSFSGAAAMKSAAVAMV